MTVLDYLNKRDGTNRNKAVAAHLLKGRCPRTLFLQQGDMLLFRMAVECCQESHKGDCIAHFLDAELGDVRPLQIKAKNY